MTYMYSFKLLYCMQSKKKIIVIGEKENMVTVIGARIIDTLIVGP